mgnify:CR=1 FL=1
MHGDRWIEEKVKRLVANELDDMGHGDAFSQANISLGSHVEIAGSVESGVIRPTYNKTKTHTFLLTSVTAYYLGSASVGGVRGNDIVLFRVKGTASLSPKPDVNALAGFCILPGVNFGARGEVTLSYSQRYNGGNIDDASSSSDKLDKGTFASLKSKTTRETKTGEDASDIVKTDNKYETHEETWVDVLKLPASIGYAYNSLTGDLNKTSVTIEFMPLQQDSEASRDFNISAEDSSGAYSIRVSGQPDYGALDLWFLPLGHNVESVKPMIAELSQNGRVWSRAFDKQSAVITDYLRGKASVSSDDDE